MFSYCSSQTETRLDCRWWPKGLGALLERQTMWLSPLLTSASGRTWCAGRRGRWACASKTALIQALGKDIESYSAALQSGQRSGAVLPLLVAVMQRTEQVARLSPTPRVLSAEDHQSAGGLWRSLPDIAESSWRSQPPALQFIQRRMLLCCCIATTWPKVKFCFASSSTHRALALVSPDRGEDSSAARDVEG